MATPSSLTVLMTAEPSTTSHRERGVRVMFALDNEIVGGLSNKVKEATEEQPVEMPEASVTITVYVPPGRSCAVSPLTPVVEPTVVPSGGALVLLPSNQLIV